MNSYQIYPKIISQNPSHTVTDMCKLIYYKSLQKGQSSENKSKPQFLLLLLNPCSSVLNLCCPTVRISP